jgi:hypothetical protein
MAAHSGSWKNDKHRAQWKATRSILTSRPRTTLPVGI